MSAMSQISEKRRDFFLVRSSLYKGGITFCILLGVLALIGAAFSLPAGRIWGSMLLSLFFFYSIALGGVAFSAMQDVVAAVWGRPIRRIHEGFAAFLLPGSLLLVIFLACLGLDIAGARSVYSWMRDPELVAHFWGKNVWLQPGFMVARDLFAVLLTLVLAVWHLRQGQKRDQLFIDGRDEEARKEALVVEKRLRYFSAPILVVFSLTYSLLCFDLLMSLSPLWFSTLWAGLLFAIMMQTLMALTLVMMFLLQDFPFGKIYGRAQFHDVGKLMHGFTIFFAYLLYAHILTYWYGNVPEETEYFIQRLEGTWRYFVIFLPFLSFALPFFVLIVKQVKWTKFIVVPLAIVVLLAQWMAYVLIVVPDLNPNPELAHYWTSSWIDFGMLALMAGIFFASYFEFGSRIPMIAVADELLPNALNGHH